MNLTSILDDCLERLAAGESVAQCLARYPEAASQLAPLLQAAEQVRSLSAARLTQGQRLRAKVALREELAAQQTRRDGAAYPLGLLSPARWRLAPVAALVAVVLFSTVAFSAVAGSEPGDLAYPVRVAVERAPIFLKWNSSGRVAAELALADRRLSDVTAREDGHSVALEALLRADAEAVSRASDLSAAERAEVADRIAKHAEELAQLAQVVSNADAGVALQKAAAEAAALASGLDVVVTSPASTPIIVASWTPSQVPSGTPLPVIVPPVSVTPPSVTPVPTPVISPIPTTGTVVVPPTVTPRPTITRRSTTTPRPTIATFTPWPMWTYTPPVVATRTPIRPRRTPEPFPTWTPRLPRLTAQPTPAVTIPATPVFTIPPTPAVTIPPTPLIPTGSPGTASVNTPTAWPTVSTPVVPTVIVPTIVVPTIGAPPTLRPPGAHLTATVVWVTFTPGPTATPRPDIRLTVTLTVSVPERPTRTPWPTDTPAPPTEAPSATATAAE